MHDAACPWCEWAGRRRPGTAPSSRICRRTCRSGTRSRRRPRRASAPSARATTTASSRACASAPPNRTSSSSTIICCAPTRRSQNAFGEVIPACSHASRGRGAPARRHRHAVLRVLGQHLSAGRLRAGRGTQPPGGAIGEPATRGNRQGHRSVARTTRAFFTELAFAHRTSDDCAAKSASARPSVDRRGARIGRSFAGALDNVEATLAPAASRDGADKAGTDADEARPGEDLAAGARRAGDIRDELRFMLRAGDPTSFTSLSSAARGFFCGRRRSMSRRSCASCCSIGCARRC